MTKFLSTLMIGVALGMGAAVATFSAGANAEVVVRDHRRPGIKVKVINPLKVVPNPLKVLW